jgi:hypothetical protein
MAASGESFPQHIYRSPSAVPEAEPLDANRLTEKNPEYPRSITEWTLYLGFRQADATTATMIW